MNFAVIKTGGKQYKVAANDVVKVEKLDAEPGDVVTFAEVLMVGNGDDVTVGAPLVEGASVAGHLVQTKKSRTVIIQKKHRRQHFDRRNGHRQILATVRIGEILVGGAKTTLTADDKLKARHAALLGSVAEAPARKAAAKPAPAKAKAPKAEAAPAAEPKAAPKAKKTEATAETKAEAGFTDDVSLISGVGATLTKKLAAAGVTSLTQIAAWSDADLKKYDEELALHGRAERDEWVQQAKDLVAGKPPRAKVDQEHAAADKAKK
ncbi:MAG: 50S ribosomal protein L21 [Devosia sp. 67-54]|uniref:50S ribosomal protein L21 n=1 Tax=unclassified Devosia TaxID=196773 RepID=UPI0009632375|nr:MULTISPECIES: 50S ribosomal protein L21 [unclassified Devosia]MBN9307206.1 50S ribosomal protein L21 [Devosia sp.]OJX19601.1 MAG: 50S ribosomal protein L21 [Devosia sp. 67-54]